MLVFFAFCFQPCQRMPGHSEPGDDSQCGLPGLSHIPISEGSSTTAAAAATTVDDINPALP